MGPIIRKILPPEAQRLAFAYLPAYNIISKKGSPAGRTAEGAVTMPLTIPRGEAAERLREAAAGDRLSHAMLFTGPGDLLGAARYAAAALECQAPPGERPCGACLACRKVAADIHPDVITVRDGEHREIAVEVVRSAVADAYICPNEGRRKVYLFPDCTLLTEKDQNVLLKIVEEGPPYAAFLFCAENGSAVLRTLRSRCVELRPGAGAEDASGLPEAAEALCRRLGEGRPGAVAELAVELERKKLSREDLAAALEGAWQAAAAALTGLYGRPAEPETAELAGLLRRRLTRTQLADLIDALRRYRGACAYNIGPGHVLGALAAELEDITCKR